ncbi:MAG: hypothetical protein WCT04_15980 [Planctomycetota bacterium]
MLKMCGILYDILDRMDADEDDERQLAMRYISIALVLFVVLLPGADCRADAPATEFFAIDTAKLAKLAPTDAALDSLSAVELSEISIAHGWYDGGLAMRFDSSTFRIDARFGGSADIRGAALPITYHIDASKDQTSWSLLSEKGAATKLGKQFVTENWRTTRITIILRFLDLKK